MWRRTISIQAGVSHRRAMDPAWLEDLRGRLLSLLIVLEERSGEREARVLQEFIDVGEYGLVLEEMAGVFAPARTPITDQERSDMLALNRTMQRDGQVPRALQSCPRSP
jgi:hypothetical protein